jgi:hypothetical protein
MKIKNISVFLIIVCLITSFSLPVFAHSGKTDANGGHYDSSTGEYHYHHGYPEHQHTNGKCPYDYEDKTNHQSRNSSSTISSEDNTPGIFSHIISFVIWALIFGLLELCLLPLFAKIKSEEWHKIAIGISIALLFGLALYLATAQPFF